MSDRFHPISMEQLTHWVFTELDRKDSLFNVPRAAFFVPRLDHRYRLLEHGLERHWLRRTPGSRAIAITPAALRAMVTALRAAIGAIET